MRMVEMQWKPGRLAVGSDWHKGGSDHEAGIKKFLERARIMPWIHLGDLLECIMPGDKRYSVDEHKDSLMDGIVDMVKLIKPASKTLIGLVEGNHERKPGQLVGSITDNIAKQLGVPFLTSECFIQFKDTKGFFCHQARVNRSRIGHPLRIEAQAKVALEEAFRWVEADFCGMGHIHQCIVKESVSVDKLSSNGGRTKMVQVNECPKWCFSCPAMYKVYDETQAVSNYAAIMLVRPTKLGWLELVFSKNKPGLDAIEQFNEHGKLINVYTPRVL